jgi:hypothetical protein
VFLCDTISLQGGDTMSNHNLDDLALNLLERKTLLQKQEYLLQEGRVQHIIEESKLSKILSKQNPDRFVNVGAIFYFRKDNDSDRKYRNICIRNAEYLYEHHPLIFEFYDEYINGTDYSEDLKYHKNK